MGTNYYLYKNICPHCSKSEDEKHIGKSSGGWCFSLHIEPENGINDLEDWKALFDRRDTVIKNEYGDKISTEDMIDIITNRSRSRKLGKGNVNVLGLYSSWEEFYAKNMAEPGPNNLLRFRISDFCVKHGDGTWDCLVGKFS